MEVHGSTNAEDAEVVVAHKEEDSSETSDCVGRDAPCSEMLLQVGIGLGSADSNPKMTGMVG